LRALFWAGIFVPTPASGFDIPVIELGEIFSRAGVRSGHCRAVLSKTLSNALLGALLYGFPVFRCCAVAEMGAYRSFPISYHA
jgi:hypothetical protein